MLSNFLKGRFDGVGQAAIPGPQLDEVLNSPPHLGLMFTRPPIVVSHPNDPLFHHLPRGKLRAFSEHQTGVVGLLRREAEDWVLTHVDFTGGTLHRFID